MAHLPFSPLAFDRNFKLAFLRESWCFSFLKFVLSSACAGLWLEVLLEPFPSDLYDFNLLLGTILGGWHHVAQMWCIRCVFWLPEIGATLIIIKAVVADFGPLDVSVVSCTSVSDNVKTTWHPLRNGNQKIVHKIYVPTPSEKFSARRRLKSGDWCCSSIMWIHRLVLFLWCYGSLSYSKMNPWPTSLTSLVTCLIPHYSDSNKQEGWTDPSQTVVILSRATWSWSNLKPIKLGGCWENPRTDKFVGYWGSQLKRTVCLPAIHGCIPAVHVQTATYRGHHWHNSYWQAWTRMQSPEAGNEATVVTRQRGSG